MKPYRLIDGQEIPGVGKVELFEHDGAFYIKVNRILLMSTRAHHSERELASIGCAGVPLDRGRVLIGGLGFGYTLLEVLQIVSANVHVTVAELLACVMAWNQDPNIGPAHAELQDARVHLKQIDVLQEMRENHESYDAILLDVDNGPSAFTADSNSRLYTASGLQHAYQALRPGGKLAIWSANADSKFLKLMEKAGFRAECMNSRARAKKGSPHFIFCGVVKS